jgi:hypothetical protein
MYEETKNMNNLYYYYDFINNIYEIICGMYSAYDELIQRELGIDEEDGIFLSDPSKDGSNKDEE